MAPVASADYDAGAQRWINRDPLEEAGGINPYGFVYNAPTVYAGDCRADCAKHADACVKGILE